MYRSLKGKALFVLVVCIYHGARADDRDAVDQLKEGLNAGRIANFEERLRALELRQQNYEEKTASILKKIVDKMDELKWRASGGINSLDSEGDGSTESNKRAAKLLDELCGTWRKK